MGDVVDFQAHKAKRSQRGCEPGEGVTILLGDTCGKLCHHCGAVLYHATVMPSATQGYACRDCDIWFDGIDY